ncbi:pentatricopeptide repeat-containing protein At1g26900, mitochondrial-like [Arachis hypogaea]|uniref:pentatricopeptide repeat-containing protein At1g26900, mitochondrial-like n=1 Tax=Arachis hypogaea TaxID=3818 RepID=UPI000DEC8102|nr:pentatricopeptide repeat-containing protein At1g26900, mitochondrial-like [Arachis hypogaea]QHO14538.1 Pentatricopeptide repeat-containing protein [Arachis hypogaea]
MRCCKVQDRVATALSLLSATADTRDFLRGKCLHGYYIRLGLISNLNVLTVLIDLYARMGRIYLAHRVFDGVAQKNVIFVELFDCFIEEEKLELDAVLGTALVNAYAKCDFLDKATDIFERMKGKDIKAGTTMISGHGIHGQPTNAAKLFNRMESEGFRPNEVTFLAVLSACSHGGLVIDGMEIFKSMVCKYGFSPRVEHYGSLIAY